MSILDKIRGKIKQLDEKKRKFWVPQVGANLIRILPWNPNEPFYFECRQHFIPWGGRSGKGMMLACLEPTKGEGKCLACNAASSLSDSDDAEDQTIGKRISAVSRYFYNIIDLRHTELGVQVWASYSDGILQDLLTYYTDPECGDFSDPSTGRNVTITKTKKGNSDAFPEYDTKVKMQISKIQNRSWLKEVKDLRKGVPVPSIADMRMLLGDSTSPIKNQKFTGSEESSNSHSVQESQASLIASLACFGKEFRRLPACPECPVRIKCKKKYMIRKTKREATAKITRKLGIG